MNKKFQIIVADPAWHFSDSLKMSDVARGADANYNTMSISDIKKLPVKDLTDKDGAILALWVPSSLLQEGLDTMKAWGFKHKQTYIWVKTKKLPLENLFKSLQLKKIKLSSIKDFIKNTYNLFVNFNMSSILSFGMGRLFRQTHEICLIGTNSNKIYKYLKNKSQRSVSFGQNLKHSKKPEHLQESLELMFPDISGGKLELFARRQRPGWTCLGNEVCDGEDITYSMSKLL